MAAWRRATTGGWLLGVPMIVVLALIGETVGLGGTQTLVGVGMGAALVRLSPLGSSSRHAPQVP